MFEITLYDERYTLFKLQRWFIDLYEVNIIGALCKDNLGWFYNYNPHTIGHLKNIIEAIEKPDLLLGEAERKWLENAKKLKDKLSSFSRENYNKLDTGEKNKYLRGFTLDCVYILEDLMKGGLGKDEPSPMKYYQVCNGMVFVKEKGGISSPVQFLDLIVDKCPFCGKDTHVTARKCEHCEKELHKKHPENE